MFAGHPSMLFFGYTHCPDVCPTTMAEMANWFETLGPDAKDLKAYFVTVDPERDTPELLGNYVSWVSDRITGITGKREEINKIISAWGVVAEKVPSSDGSYTMNHTASIFLLDKAGKFTGTIAYQEDTETALEKIRRLIGESLVAEQIRAARAGEVFTLFAPPFVDLAVVARGQHGRDLAALEQLRPGVVRIFQNAVLETLVGVALLGAEHAGQSAAPPLRAAPWRPLRHRRAHSRRSRLPRDCAPR